MNQRYFWVDALVVIVVGLAAAGVAVQMARGANVLSVIGQVLILVVLGGVYLIIRVTEPRRRRGHR